MLIGFQHVLAKYKPTRTERYCTFLICTLVSKECQNILIKVALGVCFALKSWKKYLLLFTYLIASSKDVTFPLITKFKTNRYLSYLSVNRIPN